MNLSILALTLPLTVGAPVVIEQPPGPAPFLYVKILPPKGTKTTWYPGMASAVSMTNPISVGLRPGYRYRLEFSDIPEEKDVKLYPSLEVRGTLHPPKIMDIAKYPVPVIFTEDDIALALRGRLVTKILILESPDKADAIQTQTDQVLEYRYNTEEEALKELEEKGRMVLIARLGERTYSKEELAFENVPGTLLFSDMKTPPLPAVPPCLPYAGVMLFDPILGPKLSTEECLTDGGDSKRILGLGPNEKLSGLDPSDTAIEFTTAKGKKVVPSNRVCICVPRFIALRIDQLPNSHSVVHQFRLNEQLMGVDRYLQKTIPNNALRTDAMKAYHSRVRPSALIGFEGTHSLDSWAGKPMAVANQMGLKVVAEVRELEQLTGYPDCKMILIKWVEPRFPEKIGDEVTFFLKYHNATTSTMEDVAISDSLTARLEYIPNSAQTDRAATFTTTPNEAGSVVLRWAIDGKLKPGEGGIIKFKARIR